MSARPTLQRVATLSRSRWNSTAAASSASTGSGSSTPSSSSSSATAGAPSPRQPRTRDNSWAGPSRRPQSGGSSSSSSGSTTVSNRGHAKIRHPPTPWSAYAWRDAAPPTRISGLVPPLPEPSTANRVPRIAIGPGASNVTSLQHAQDGLTFKISKDSSGFQQGPKGTIAGVPFTRRGASFSASGSLVQATKQQREAEYLEREGGDYSGHLPSSASLEGEDWEAVASQALSQNTSIPLEARQSVIGRLGSIVKGEPFVAQPAAKDTPSEDKGKDGAAKSKGGK